ncbi:MAG: T9SS type A sorting domain-containing protein [Chitinophagaceae bacterium]|nr:T9SS type A sorting domain-containing protein [Chitinophagaceae bacterium]
MYLSIFSKIKKNAKQIAIPLAILFIVTFANNANAQCPVVDKVTLIDSVTPSGCFIAIVAEYHPVSSGESSMLIKYSTDSTNWSDLNAGCMGDLKGLGAGTPVKNVILTNVPCSAPSLYVLMESHSNGTCGGNACSSTTTLIQNPEGGPTPVKLSDFEVLAQGQSAKILWSTATESNNKGFDVERSNDGKNWSSIGFVSSSSESGSSSITLNYQFTDGNPANGVNYYRLKQIDFDGRYEFSPVRVARFGEINSMNVFPNPFNNGFTASFSANKTADANMIIRNTLGQPVMQRTIQAVKGSNSVNISNLSSLKPGIYYINITNDDINYNIKLQKQ